MYSILKSHRKELLFKVAFFEEKFRLEKQVTHQNGAFFFF